MHPIDHLRGHPLQPRIGRAVGPARQDNLIPLPPFCEHGVNQLGGILEVRIDRNHHIPSGMIQRCGQSRLLSEISGEIDHTDALILFGLIHKE